MAGEPAGPDGRLRLRLPACREPVLAQRCCCREWVPNWCCRADVYRRRLEALHAERRESDAAAGLELNREGFLTSTGILGL